MPLPPMVEIELSLSRSLGILSTLAMNLNQDELADSLRKTKNQRISQDPVLTCEDDIRIRVNALTDSIKILSQYAEQQSQEVLARALQKAVPMWRPVDLFIMDSETAKNMVFTLESALKDAQNIK